MKSLRLVLFSLLLTLGACSSINPISMVRDLVGDNSGRQTDVDSEIVVGDKNTSSDVQLGSRQNADTINNITDIPPFVLILLVLGWVMPTPARIFELIRSKTRKE